MGAHNAMNWTKSLIRIFLTMATVCLCAGHIDMTAYRQMPPLYLADDYDQCLQQQPAAAYCMVYVEIEPKVESSVWQQLDEFYKSSPNTLYRHDQLYRGVCTAKCKNYPKTWDQWDAGRMQATGENVEWAQELYAISRSQQSIREYEQQVHQCVNAELLTNYNLSAKTFVRYCDNPREPIERDSRFTNGILVFIGILVLNILSTLYDAHLKTKQNEKELSATDYYDTKHKNSVDNYLTAFSLYRNFRRLVKPNNSAIGKDLSFIDGFRTFMSMIIIFEHVVMIQFYPTKNSEFFEEAFSSLPIKWLMHMMVCIEIFFVMTGLMMYIKFAKDKHITETSSFRECVEVYVRMMISRYLRYIPSLLTLIFFTTNVFFHLGNGPFWRLAVEPNVQTCRCYWWSNLFMIENLNVNHACWFHTWYIAADFQLYASFLAILIITARFPKYKTLIYSLVGIVGLSLPSIINYAYKLDSVTTFMMEQYRHFFIQAVETSNRLYVPHYTNLNGFFVGILCAELYMKYLNQDKYRKMLRPYLQPSPIVGFGIIFSIWYMGTFIIFKDHTIWTSLFSIVHRHLSIAIVATVVILRGMCNGGGFLASPIFRPLARISYQVYLWHLIILVRIFASYRQLPEVSYYWMLYTHPFVYVLAAIVSTIMATIVEYPMAELFGAFDLKNKPKTVKSS